MLRTILIYGIIGGIIVTVPMDLQVLAFSEQMPPGWAMFVGYATMIVALTSVFLGIKQYRDKTLGGVIKFLPALGVGLGISIIAGVIYVAGWDISLALTKWDFAKDYAQSTVAAAQAQGASAAELEKTRAEMAEFAKNYANPLYRWPMTFIEIFPVGVLISLISAALLRNSRFMPAREKLA